ncbi:DEAD/DEAH box helicase [Catenovulum maritimum]|uniref:ATP-dependent RNA helicase DeaD n=1 Tax=Catenovulum maritimum TaxID=1513271 RepID=A0A0J8GT33_9ALTE|nr:DEAD/DEAH box helicase [Catenovulum maritimum]KMT63863.1 RNA helicase [Catenovulum maritimum]
MSNTESTVQFNELGLPAPILQAIESMGFTQPTPIQEKSIPALLEGKDILGEAQTGTGKTAAFGLPLLANLDANLRKTQMLVVCPTRELAIQVAEALSDFSKNLKGFKVATVYGGQSYTPQIRDLRAGPQVVVGTPGRLMDHIDKGRLQLDNLKACVLDEADEMLNMGFLEDIQWILEHVPDSTQMAFFSATMPPAIKRVTQQFLKSPVHVKIAPVKAQKANISQKAWRVSKIGKTAGLERIAETVDYDAMIVFVRTRNDTLMLAEHLVSKGFSASALNGDMNQNDRERIVDQLKNGKLSILIATDVVARGLDVPRITHVINYDLPTDSESYVHRIGRTGRAGRSGEAILFANYREIRGLSRLERATDGRIETFEMPDVKDLGKIRADKIKSQLQATIESQDLEQFRGVLNQFVEESEQSLEDIATALLFQQQLKQPLFPKADPVDSPRDRNRREARDGGRGEGRGRRDRNDRGGERANRGERGGDRGASRPRRNDADFDTFRFEVGRSDGVRPGDIVGAVANEINLDSSNIGHIKLHDNHSYVDLPKGMPKTVFDKLTKISIRNKRATPRVADPAEKAASESSDQAPKFRPRRDDAQPRRRERRPFN